jgi:hypothetical protein
MQDIFFSLTLQPSSGLGRLHETFRFTSVTRSRTVGRTPWTDDQLLARPLPKHKTTQTLHIYFLRGIRTHCPGVRASEDSSCLRPLGYRDRPMQDYYSEFMVLFDISSKYFEVEPNTFLILSRI